MDKNAKELQEYAFEYIRKYASAEDIIEMFEIFANENPNGGFIKDSIAFRDQMIGVNEEKED